LADLRRRTVTGGVPGAVRGTPRRPVCASKTPPDHTGTGARRADAAQQYPAQIRHQEGHFHGLRYRTASYQGDAVPKPSTSREPLLEGDPSPQRSSELRRSTSREPLSEGEPSPRRSLERRRSTSRKPLLEGEPSPRRSSERRGSTSRKPLFEGEPPPRRSLERRRPPLREPLTEGKPSLRRSLKGRRPPPREPLSEGRLSPRRSLERRRPPPREPLSEGEASLRRSPKRRRPPPRRRLSREHRSPRRPPSILSSSSDTEDNELYFSNGTSVSGAIVNEDGDANEDVHITRKDLRSDLKSFRRVILLGLKKYSKNILKKRHNRNTGMVEFFEGVFLEQKWLLKAATARKMSLRANHVMRAYWSRSKRMNLYAKNPKGLRNAIEVQSKEYQDLIDICNALPKINSEKSRFFCIFDMFYKQIVHLPVKFVLEK
ncbi:hypothetical protein KQX54_011508, partial [Cotesia glomerata]